MFVLANRPEASGRLVSRKLAQHTVAVFQERFERPFSMPVRPRRAVRHTGPVRWHFEPAGRSPEPHGQKVAHGAHSWRRQQQSWMRT